MRQSWALTRRYGITLLRSPIGSVLRLIIFPLSLIGLLVYLLINYADQQKEVKIELANYIPGVTWILTSYTLYHFCNVLVTDKQTGFKSLMISMGLKRESYYLSYSLSYIAYALPVMITIAVLSLLYILVESHSSPVLIFLVFMMFVVHTTGLIFVFASFITSTSYTPLILLLLVAENFVPSLVFWVMKQTREDMRPLVLFFASMSPYESLRILCQGYTLCKNCDISKMDDHNVSTPVYLILIAMTFWSTVCFLFARWFEEVCPWQHDSAVKNPFFCCDSGTAHPDLDNVEFVDHSSKFFEKTSNNREIGISISKLMKSFKSIPAVNDISFNIYKGETTLLLGHNGAGKTTLMDIVLGKLTPDHGRVKINHHAARLDGVSSSIGVCPQASILDDNLNVRQHLTLFADIKASFNNGIEYENHIRTTIDDVSLTSHSLKVPKELSGGMKRKLSLALAFVGKSNVLILDEPSSGLDPDSRVFVWNAIRRYRSDRTVLLSTQHMEEADYLGDRIAIMSEGKIICCGSSTFLNNIFGNGYKLRVECHESKKKQVLMFIRKFFHSARPSEVDQVVGSTGTKSTKDPVQDMIIELNDEKSKDLELKLIEMLEEIEANQSALHIKSYGLKSSSIEDVLLNTSKAFHREPTDSVQLTLTSKSGHIATLASPLRAPDKGFLATQWMLLCSFMTKHINTYKRDWTTFLLYRVLIATFVMWQLIADLNSSTLFPIRKSDLFPALLVFHFIYYPTLERLSKFKTMQLTSYGNFIVYWLAFILIDFLSVIVLGFNVNLFLLVTFNGKFIASQEIVHLWATLAIILFGLSAATLAYILSLVFNDSKSAIGYHFLFYAISPAFNVLILILKLTTQKDLNWLQEITQNIFTAIFPVDALQYVFYGFSTKCYIESKFSMSPCSDKSNHSPVHLGVAALALQLIAHLVILFLAERTNIDLSWYFRWRNMSCKGYERVHHSDYGSMDEDVLGEKTKADQMIENPQSHALVASNLSKSYIKGVKVVDQLSFTVAKGECFGLLGVNGAGKSTTFAMLVAESKPDTGRLWANGHYNSENIDIYRCKLGYDPQSNPEISLSPVEALYLMARLRKVNEQSIPMLVNSVLELLSMNEHAHKPTQVLSGGTKRKLALGMSLIGNPLLLALDEPTAGVDPVARRSIWQLLRSLRMQNGSSIVISSHAMEECEAICDRISIMARGHLRCIGTFLHLRSKFSQGCRVKVNFTATSPNGTGEHSTAAVNKIVASLNQSLQSSFGTSVKLVDTNLNSATFNVSDDKVKRSILFKILREFRQNHPNMSYMVNDSSLEDIFITLAREQQELEQQQTNAEATGSCHFV